MDKYKKRMTPADYCRYNGALCPYCKSLDINEAGGFKTQDSVTYQPIKCNECGKRWTDIRGLVSYEEMETENV